MRRLFCYVKPYVPMMCVGLVIKIIGSLMDLCLPWILAHILDVVAPVKDIKLIFAWGALMIICAFIAKYGNVKANQMASRVARDTIEDVRHNLFEKTSYLTCSQIDEFTVPSLEARLTTDTYNLHNMLGMMQRIGVRAPILLIGGIVVTMLMEPVLTMVLICTLPFMAFITVYVSKKGIRVYDSLQKAIDNLVRIVRENITGVRVIKALSKTDYEKTRFDKANAEVVKCDKKASIIMAVTNPTMSLLLNVGLAVVIIVGAYRVNSGITGSGKIIAFLSYFTIILNALMMITRIFVNYTKGVASANRISAVLDAKDEIEVLDIARENTENHIEFKNVSFSYYKKRNSIENISFNLKKGESLGIIGATGSGKSTLISVLMRLYDIDSGQILINGRDIKSIPMNELHQMFGIVFQSDTIFADTIKNNIGFGRDLTEKDIERAVEVSQAKEFISSLTDGLDHMLTAKGTNLSGGQKQRVLLARAVAGNPQILILDDSSSALDYKTDSLLRASIEENCKGTSTIIIAQRISSVMKCSHILMLDDGKIIGSGAHEELMQNCSEYREISELQMGGVENE